MSVQGIAGGALIEQLRDTLLEKSVIKNLLEAKNKQRRRPVLKERALGVVVSGAWRKKLEGSMAIVRSLLDKAAEGLESAGYDVVDLHFYLASPGLVGIGSGVFKAIFEVGLEMDWLLGLPVIRGSSIKGAARTLIEEIADDAPGLRESLDVFFGSTGTNGRRGAVIVLDSYPVGCRPGYPCLVLTGDVIAPHYYEGGKAVDSEAKAVPKPIQHVAIAPGTVFRVVAGVPGRDLDPDLDAYAEKILKAFGVKPSPGVQARLYALGIALQAALSNGVGARSGKGYNVLLPYTGDYLDTRVVGLRLYASKEFAGKLARKGSPGGYRPGLGGPAGKRGGSGGLKR